MLVVLLLCGLAAADLQEDPNTCANEADDCVEGHVSLLQESLKLTKLKPARAEGHKAGNAARARLQNRIKKGQKLRSGVSSSVWIVGGIVLIVLVFWLAFLRGGAANVPTGSEEEDDMEIRVHDHLDEDTYSLAIAMLVKDLRDLSAGHGRAGLKYSRIAFALGLIAVTLGIQISVLVCVKQFVTPLQVADIRDAYDMYEEVMYAGHTYLNVNGKQRGEPGYFDPSLFDTLSDDDKSDVCNIPFSQLSLLGLILIIWSITCFAQLKNCFENFFALIIFGKTLDTMKDSLCYWKDAMEADEDDKPAEFKHDTPRGAKPVVDVQVIVGLTAPVKAFLFFGVFLPEFLATCYILWLGSRWLTATNDFGDLVSNAVALEFTLQLKSIFYYALTSDRLKRDLEYTGIQPPWSREGAGYGVYFNTVFWGALAFAWVPFYVFYYQKVLPDYHWDVHVVCDTFLLSILDS